MVIIVNRLNQPSAYVVTTLCFRTCLTFQWTKNCCKVLLAASCGCYAVDTRSIYRFEKISARESKSASALHVKNSFFLYS